MGDHDYAVLERRIQKIEDIQAIKDLKARYANACDDFYNPEKMGEIFAEDAVWDGGEDFGRYEGRAAIKQFFADVSKDIEFAMHYFVQPRIELSEDGATAEAVWYLWQASTLKGNKAVWLSGFEYDKYRKDDGRWWKPEMKLEILFLTPYEEGWHKVKIIK